MKKILGVVIVVIIVILIIALSGGKKGEAGPIRIGFVGPLTGDLTALGAASRAAAEIAVDEFNKAGGLDGRNVQLIAEDGKCSPAPATSAAQKLINVDKVAAVVGGLCSGETTAIMSVATPAQVPVVAYCSSAPSLSSAGAYFFRTYPSDAYQGKYAAEYAYNTLGARKVAVLYHISDWGTGIKEVFSKRFSELGGTVVAEEGTAQEVRDYKTQLSKIKALAPDYLYTPMYTEGALVAVQQMFDLGIKAKILGADAWGDTKFVQEVNKKADILFVGASVPENAEFNTKVLTKIGGTQVPTCAPQAYDAARTVLMALKENKGIGADLAGTIRSIHFTGISGPIQFDQNGDMTSAVYSVKRIQDGKTVEVK